MTFTIENIKVTKADYASDGQKWNAVGTRSGRATISVDIKDESLMDNLVYRKSRPTKIYRDIINQVRAQITDEYEIDLSEFVWNQKAFCSCGCSPAFLVLSDRGWNISITVSGIENVADKTGQARAESIGAELVEA